MKLFPKTPKQGKRYADIDFGKRAEKLKQEQKKSCLPRGKLEREVGNGKSTESITPAGGVVAHACMTSEFSWRDKCMVPTASLPLRAGRE